MKRNAGFLAGFLASALVFALVGCGGRAANAPAPSQSITGPVALTLAADRTGLPFTDVPAEADYAEAVAWCYENGILNGTSATTFSPDTSLSRAMIVTALYRAAGEPAVSGSPGFTDTQAGAWYSNAVVWADRQGIVRGYGNGRFGTNDPVSVEQMEVILGRYIQNGVQWVGDPAKAQAATRAQVAVALYGALKDGAPGQSNSAVYMTDDISAQGLMAVYEALNAAPSGKVAVKLSTGEPGSNYLRTDLIGELVQSLDATIVECNTAYGGSRSNTAMHYQVAEDHGYTAIAEVDIMDEEGSMTLPVVGGDNLTENYVGSHFADYDYFVVLSHFKGHAMAGYGGAIKNISIGIASAEGKNHIHTGGKGGSMWSAPQDPFLESMAEAGKSVVDALDGNILYINVMNRLSVDCDCDGNPAQPDMHDIGILASYDPVALDQACIDLVYAAGDGQSLINRIESRNGLHTLEQAEKIGLGSREYELVSIDGQENTNMSNQINVTFNGKAYTATLADNTSAQAFAAYLKEQGGSITVSASDYGNFEKVGPLGAKLVTNNEQITTGPGDIILYQGDQIVLYYATNSWNFTRLGKLDGDLSNLKADLGSGDVNITYSLAD